MKKILEMVIFTAMIALAAVGIRYHSWLHYDWQTFLPYHVGTGIITFVLMVKYIGRMESGQYEMLSKNYTPRFRVLFILTCLLLGPVGVLATIATMLQHYVRYGKFTWR